MKWKNKLREIQQIPKAEKLSMYELGTDKRCQKPLSSPFVSSQLVHGSKFDAVKDVLFIRYDAQLERVKNDSFLANAFDDICEERKAIMIANGSNEVEAEAYVSDLGFLTEVLLTV